MRRWGVALLVCVCIFVPGGLLGNDAPAIGVLYPDIREPFRSVFMSIARGVSDELGSNAQLRTVADSDSPAEIQRWIESNGIRSVVALGSRGQALSDDLAGTVPVVLGAVHMSQDLQERHHYGIALSPDPSLMLERLSKLAPSVKRVTVVHHRERDQWTVARARASAARLGIELNAVPVDRLQEAVSAYRSLIGTLDSRSDALWLSQDSAVLDEQAVLPMILKEAWDRKLIVFSSNPSHVRRGILFALYPDNYRMGRSLGKMADRINNRPGNGAAVEPGMEFLRDLSMAFNVRTAGHLGIRYSKELLNEAELVFPL
jgi:putative ABC transport system substrate-binding protein